MGYANGVSPLVDMEQVNSIKIGSTKIEHVAGYYWRLFFYPTTFWKWNFNHNILLQWRLNVILNFLKIASGPLLIDYFTPSFFPPPAPPVTSTSHFQQPPPPPSAPRIFFIIIGRCGGMSCQDVSSVVRTFEPLIQVVEWRRWLWGCMWWQSGWWWQEVMVWENERVKLEMFNRSGTIFRSFRVMFSILKPKLWE